MKPVHVCPFHVLPDPADDINSQYDSARIHEWQFPFSQVVVGIDPVSIRRVDQKSVFQTYDGFYDRPYQPRQVCYCQGVIKGNTTY